MTVWFSGRVVAEQQKISGKIQKEKLWKTNDEDKWCLEVKLYVKVNNAFERIPIAPYYRVR